MPQLPSGRHVAFSNPRLSDPAEYGLTNEDLERIDTIEDLAPFIDVQLFREPTLFDGHRLATSDPLAPGSSQPPSDLLAYETGHTLATLDVLTAEWSDDDAVALREFIASARFQNHLHDTLHEVHIATGRVKPTFVDVVLYDPAVRDLYERTDD